MVCDQSDNVIIGEFFDETVDFDPRIGNETRISNATDFFLLKLNTNGDFIDVHTTDFSNENEVIFDLEIDNNQEIVATGYYSGTADFDDGTRTISLSSACDRDIFILKIDTLSNVAWAHGIGGADRDYGQDLAINDLNEIIVTGYYETTVDFDPSLNVVQHTAIFTEDSLS
ncbi:MAG: hypothetical protein MK066_14230 [Crocinitomicaceae bacterium]|nr:hypothetical protein [Crocinitomicaceae bacterium]